MAATLEALIVDTFTRIEGDREVPMNKGDQIGGAGTYAIIGARIFLQPEDLTMVVHYTPDTFPAPMEDVLRSFGDIWDFRLRDDGNGTTRAVNRYDGEKREFEYLSPPRLIYPSDLGAVPEWLHFVSFPDRALRVLNELQSSGASPGILWEPEPPCCVPENLDVIAQITRQVDVVSPNHTEAMALFGASPSSAQLTTTVEWLVRRLVALRPRLAAIVRAGPLGCCYALTAQLPPGSVYDPHMTVPPCVPVYWVPPFWLPSDEGAVVDPTGAGNGFMGGLMAGLLQGKGINDAMIWANVAASFMIEQDGLPKLAVVNGSEVWNGAYPTDRVKVLRERVSSTPSGGIAQIGAGPLTRNTGTQCGERAGRGEP